MGRNRFKLAGKRSSVAELNAQLGNIVAERVQARADADAAAAVFHQAKQEFTVRFQQYSDKRVARSSLFDGEATETHRSRINAARISEQEACTQKASEASSASSELAVAQEASTTAGRHRDACQTEHDTAEAALVAAVASSQIDRDLLASLLAIDPQSISKLRLRIGQVDHAVLQAEAALAERQKDLATALAAGTPEIARAQLEAERTGLDERQAGRQSQNGAIRSQLEGDDAVRASVVKIDHEIVAAKEVAIVWKAVNASVGSRNGDRFQRFAHTRMGGAAA